MKLNRLIAEMLSAEASELLNMLAANAVVNRNDADASLHYLPVEEDSWNSTVILMREIFEAEVLLSGDQEWLSFRILESFGVSQGRITYQFTPIFAKSLSV